jgi:hypothetical protein
LSRGRRPSAEREKTELSREETVHPSREGRRPSVC